MAVMSIPCSKDGVQVITERAERFAREHGLHSKVVLREANAGFVNGGVVYTPTDPYAQISFTQLPVGREEPPCFIILNTNAPSEGIFEDFHINWDQIDNFKPTPQKP